MTTNTIRHANRTPEHIVKSILVCTANRDRPIVTTTVIANAMRIELVSYVAEITPTKMPSATVNALSNIIFEGYEFFKSINFIKLN